MLKRYMQGQQDEARHEESWRKAKRRLGAMKTAAPLVRAIISRPGLGAEETELGRTLGILATKTRDLACDLWDAFLEDGAEPGHSRYIVALLAQQTAQVVAHHWEQGSELAREGLVQLLIESADAFLEKLPPGMIEEERYETRLAKQEEWRLSIARATSVMATAVMSAETSLGHDRTELVRRMVADLGSRAATLTRSFDLAPGDEQLTVEQSLLGALSHGYATLWLSEIEEVRRVLGTMNPEQRRDFASQPYDLERFWHRCGRLTDTIQDTSQLMENLLDKDCRWNQEERNP